MREYQKLLLVLGYDDILEIYSKLHMQTSRDDAKTAKSRTRNKACRLCGSYLDLMDCEDLLLFYGREFKGELRILLQIAMR